MYVKMTNMALFTLMIFYYKLLKITQIIMIYTK